MFLLIAGCTTRSKSTCGRSARRRGSWYTATHHSQTCRTRVTYAGRSSRPFASPTPFHDLFTISCIYVLNPPLRDQIQTSCSMCASFFFVDRSITCSLFFFFFSFLFCRFILYGLRAHALRLSGCWVSVRRSTSSSYFDRVAILTDISIFFFSNKCGTKSFFLLSFIFTFTPVFAITYAHAPQWLLPLQLLSRITLPRYDNPHNCLSYVPYNTGPNMVISLTPPQLLSVITPLSIYYYPVTTFFFSFFFVSI